VGERPAPFDFDAQQPVEAVPAGAAPKAKEAPPAPAPAPAPARPVPAGTASTPAARPFDGELLDAHAA
jgi:hypothetical protein